MWIVDVHSQISSWVQQTSQSTPLALELSLYTVSSPLGRIQHLRTLLQLYMYSQSLQFNFLVPPGAHHCWVVRGLSNTSMQLKPPSWQSTICCYCCCCCASTAIPGRPGPPTIGFKCKQMTVFHIFPCTQATFTFVLIMFPTITSSPLLYNSARWIHTTSKPRDYQLLQGTTLTLHAPPAPECLAGRIELFKH